MANNIIEVFGKLVNKTDKGKIVDWGQVDNAPDLDELAEKVGVTGSKIVNKTQLDADVSLRFKANAMYVIQCYDSKGDTKEFTISSTRSDISKTISGTFAMVWVGQVTEVGEVFDWGTIAEGAEWFDSLAVAAKIGSTFLSSSGGTLALATTVTPSSGNSLYYYEVRGVTPEGTKVVANPTTDATEDLDKITIGDKTYFVGQDSTSKKVPLYRHIVHDIITLTVRNSPTVFNTIRLWFTFYSSDPTTYKFLTQYAIDLYSRGHVFIPCGGVVGVGDLTTPSESNSTMSFIGTVNGFTLEPGIETRLKVFYTAQNITFDKNNQTVTAINAWTYTDINDEDIWIKTETIEDTVTDLYIYTAMTVDEAATIPLMDEVATVPVPIVEETSDNHVDYLYQKALERLAEQEQAETAIDTESTASTDEYEVFINGESVGTVTAEASDTDKGGEE